MPSSPLDLLQRRASVGTRSTLAGPRWPAMALAVGTALLACAAIVHRQVKKAEAACPPKGRFITVDGVRLHYIERGRPDAAQTVVLLHGNGSDGRGVRDQRPAPSWQRKRYRVIAFDRPGFGYSDRPRRPARGRRSEQARAAAAHALDAARRAAARSCSATRGAR